MMPKAIDRVLLQLASSHAKEVFLLGGRGQRQSKTQQFVVCREEEEEER
jgi:hypothetical protein